MNARMLALTATLVGSCATPQELRARHVDAAAGALACIRWAQHEAAAFVLRNLVHVDAPPGIQGGRRASR